MPGTKESTMDSAGVTVIIPTTCEQQRRESLLRAIHSALTQSDVMVDLIIVANGKRYDHQLLDMLRVRTDLRVHYIEQGSHAVAQRAGRSLVTQPFFAFIDDDDEFLPGALATRMAPMLKDNTLDVVATNGYWEFNGIRMRIEDPDAVNRDALAALIKENWLASCGGLYRSNTVPVDFFDGATLYFEWTLLAFRLLFAGKRILFLNHPTYRINDTPQSVSKSTTYHDALPLFLGSILKYDMPAKIRKALHYKICNAWHALSDNARNSGRKSDAWRYHLKSLKERGGWRYLAYTRRLFF